MVDFIDWCNNNVGFISIVLSALTILVSIIAIVVSIRTARLPYKKKVKVTSGSYISSESLGCYVTATNIGNRKIKIENIGLKCGDKVLINPKTIADSRIFLDAGDTTTQYFDLTDLKKQLRATGFDPKLTVKAFAEDTEGRIYQKRLSSVQKIQSLDQ